MRSLSRVKLVLPFVAALAAVAVMPGSASAFHTDITGVASCLATNGTYSVTWTVTVPNEPWAVGFTATLSSTVTLSPVGSLAPGQSATGTGTGYSAATAAISVTSTWTSGNVETDTGSVARPTTPCPTPPTTTTIVTVPTSTAAAVDVCTNIDGAQTAVPVGYVASGTTCTPASATPAPTSTAPSGAPAAAPADMCSNLAGVQASVPSGYVQRNGRCISSAAAAAGVSGTSGASGLLPETGASIWPSLLAAAFIAAGALALWLVGRPDSSAN